MPIINAVYSTWDVGALSLPDYVSQEELHWTTPKDFVVTNLQTQQISTMDFDVTTNKGRPHGTMWDVGDTVWQVDFSVPFLVPLDFKSVTSDTAFHCANLPVVDGDAHPVSKFVWGAMSDHVGIEAATDRDLSDVHDFDSEYKSSDFIIQRLSLEVTDERSQMSVTMISTQDPRPWFTLKPVGVDAPSVASGIVTTSTPWDGEIGRFGWRTAAPWDFVLPPNDTSILGGDVSYEGTESSDWPVTRAVSQVAPSSRALVRGIEVEVTNELQRFRTLGASSSRPFLGVSSKQVQGTLRYTPIRFAGENTSSGVATRYPEGWLVDYQCMERYARSGGQLYVAGSPPYTEQGGQSPMFVEIAMRKGLSNLPGYYVLRRDTLGPIGVARTSVNARPGDTNIIEIDFKTLVGMSREDLREAVSS